MGTGGGSPTPQCGWGVSPPHHCSRGAGFWGKKLRPSLRKELFLTRCCSGWAGPTTALLLLQGSTKRPPHTAVSSLIPPLCGQEVNGEEATSSSADQIGRNSPKHPKLACSVVHNGWLAARGGKNTEAEPAPAAVPPLWHSSDVLSHCRLLPPPPSVLPFPCPSDPASHPGALPVQPTLPCTFAGCSAPQVPAGSLLAVVASFSSGEKATHPRVDFEKPGSHPDFLLKVHLQIHLARTIRH